MKTYGITTMSGFASEFVAYLIMEHEEFLKYSYHTHTNDNGVEKLNGLVNRYNPIPKEVAVEKYRTQSEPYSYVLADKIKMINELDTIAQYSATIEEHLDNFYPGSNYTSDSKIITYIGPNENMFTVSTYLNEYKNNDITIVLVGATYKLHINKMLDRRMSTGYIRGDKDISDYESARQLLVDGMNATEGLNWIFVDSGKLVIDGDENEYLELCNSFGLTPNVEMFKEKLAWYKANMWNA